MVIVLEINLETRFGLRAAGDSEQRFSLTDSRNPVSRCPGKHGLPKSDFWVSLAWGKDLMAADCLGFCEATETELESGSAGSGLNTGVELGSRPPHQRVWKGSLRDKGSLRPQVGRARWDGPCTGPGQQRWCSGCTLYSARGLYSSPRGPALPASRLLTKTFSKPTFPFLMHSH